MRKFLGIIALCVLAGTAAAQQQTDYSKVEIKVTQVSGNIYLLQGSGGNIAASVGDDGILIVDDEFAPLADKIRAALKNIGVSAKPVRFVINTHYHGDHTNGNLPFGESGAIIIAQDNLRKHLEEGASGGSTPSMHNVMPPQPKAALPIITFDHDLTVHLNGDDIHAVHFPHAHTDGDSIIFFPKNNVVHMGDIFVRYGFPFVDVNEGGTVQGMIAACDAVVAQMPADAKVIPGHGAISSLDDVRAYSEMLKDTSAAVQKALKKHKTLDQMKQEKILAPWEQKWNNGFVNTDRFTETIYYSLTGSKIQSTPHN
jgi:cyclase